MDICSIFHGFKQITLLVNQEEQGIADAGMLRYTKCWSTQAATLEGGQTTFFEMCLLTCVNYPLLTTLTTPIQIQIQF